MWRDPDEVAAIAIAHAVILPHRDGRAMTPAEQPPPVAAAPSAVTSNAVFWGIWKFALSAAALFVALAIAMSTCDAIEAHKRREAAERSRRLISPADAADGMRPAKSPDSDPLPSPEIDRILRGEHR